MSCPTVIFFFLPKFAFSAENSKLGRLKIRLIVLYVISWRRGAGDLATASEPEDPDSNPARV
jgi:hypothetical protein